jgi:hypothetical protein
MQAGGLDLCRRSSASLSCSASAGDNPEREPVTCLLIEAPWGQTMWVLRSVRSKTWLVGSTI